MGIGVGGDYPLSAVITAEFSSTQYRGGIIAAVFAMQGLGQLAAALMTLIVVVAYKDHLQPVASVAACTGQCTMVVDKMWRIIIAFGGVPGWFALYYRLTIPGEQYRVDSQNGADKYRNTSLHFRCAVRCREGEHGCEKI
jgi:PHS family inorganic phosphate transporter-like MFS transporter